VLDGAATQLPGAVVLVTGFPLSLEEASEWRKVLPLPDLVVQFDCPDETCVERLTLHSVLGEEAVTEQVKKGRRGINLVAKEFERDGVSVTKVNADIGKLEVRRQVRQSMEVGLARSLVPDRGELTVFSALSTKRVTQHCCRPTIKSVVIAKTLKFKSSLRRTGRGGRRCGRIFQIKMRPSRQLRSRATIKRWK
jgi:hypothetical protein